MNSTLLHCLFEFRLSCEFGTPIFRLEHLLFVSNRKIMAKVSAK